MGKGRGSLTILICNQQQQPCWALFEPGKGQGQTSQNKAAQGKTRWKIFRAARGRRVGVMPFDGIWGGGARPSPIVILSLSKAELRDSLRKHGAKLRYPSSSNA